MNYLKKLEKDLFNHELPRNFDDWEKCQFEPDIGLKVGWWFKEDQDFALEDGLDLVSDPPYQGLLVPVFDKDVTRLELEDYMVCVTQYPCEKCNPETDWVALRQMVDNETLIQIIPIQ